MADQIQLVQFSARLAEAGSPHLFANDRQQIAVLVEISIYLYRDGAFFQRPLTESERNSVSLCRWAEQDDGMLPFGWSVDHFRNQYVQGSPQEDWMMQQDVAAAQPSNPTEVIPRYLRTSVVDTQNFMAQIYIEGLGSVTTFGRSPPVTISSTAPAVILARDLLRRDHVVIDEERAGNQRRLFIVSYFDFANPRITAATVRFYTGIHIQTMPFRSLQFYRRATRCMGGTPGSEVYLTPAQILGSDIIENLHDPHQQMLMEPAAFRGFIFDDSEINVSYTWIVNSIIHVTDNFGNFHRYVFSEGNQEVVIDDDQTHA